MPRKKTVVEKVKAAVKRKPKVKAAPVPEPVAEALPMCPENYPHLYDEFMNPK